MHQGHARRTVADKRERQLKRPCITVAQVSRYKDAREHAGLLSLGCASSPPRVPVVNACR
jgi:hypothetical protein